MSPHTPTEPFAHLSLGSHSEDYEPPSSPMAPPETVRARALEMQDFLSSFDATALPSEVQTQTFNNIIQNVDRPHGLRPRQTEWTISGNLEGTLLQWACYHEDVLEVLRRMQAPDMMAFIFHQKIKARFDAQIKQYDALVGTSLAPSTLRERVLDVVQSLSDLSELMDKDRERRQHQEIPVHVEIQTLSVVLETIEAVCERNQPIVPEPSSSPRRTRGRATSSTTGITLYGSLILQPEGTDDVFLLDCLDKFSPQVLRARSDLLDAITAILKSNAAPLAYVEKFETLQRKAKNPDQTTEVPSSSGSRGRKTGLEAEPKTGTKRGQIGTEATPSTPKRGKKTGGK